MTEILFASKGGISRLKQEVAPLFQRMNEKVKDPGRRSRLVRAAAIAALVSLFTGVLVGFCHGRGYC